MPELKLLHFWVINTASTVAPEGQEYLYNNVLVEVGFKHHYVLNGLMAVAAVHKAVTTPLERQDLMLQSSMHYDAAISEYMKHMGRPDPATCVPVCALGIILHMHYHAVAQINPPKDPIAEICSWTTLLKGIGETSHLHYDRLRYSEIGPLLGTGRDESMDVSKPSEVLCLKRLVEGVADVNQREVYEKTVACLHEVYLNVWHTKSADPRAIRMVSTRPVHDIVAQCKDIDDANLFRS